jgi:hypothetical protein
MDSPCNNLSNHLQQPPPSYKEDDEPTHDSRDGAGVTTAAIMALFLFLIWIVPKKNPT